MFFYVTQIKCPRSVHSPVVIRENLYKKEKGKNLSESKIKEIEKNLAELEENLLKSKKYYEYDDSEYRGIRNVRDLFDLFINEDYCEPILVKSAFDGNYIQYESREVKGKNLSIKRYLKNNQTIFK